jgi:large conductance mechanosensitive channel
VTNGDEFATGKKKLNPTLPRRVLAGNYPPYRCPKKNPGPSLSTPLVSSLPSATMMTFLRNLKRFLLRGNIVNYVVAIGIGSAFVVMINAFVKGIVMPLVYHYVLQEPEMSRKKVVICAAKAACDKGPAKPEVAMQYGLLIEAVLNFFFIALSLYGILSLLMHFDASRDLIQGGDGATSAAHHHLPTPQLLLAQRTNDLLIEIRDALAVRGK